MKEQIIELLEDLHIDYRWLDHAPVFTVTESLGLIEDKKPIKNLLLKDKGGRQFLVIMAGNERLNLKLLATQLDARKLQFADSDNLYETLGVQPGAVSVFGLLHPKSVDVKVVLDQAILQDDQEIGFHPNNNTATIFFKTRELKTIINKIDRKYMTISLY